jgi:hypothetical protein
MPRTSKADAPIAIDEPVIEGRYVELDGYTVGFETHKADMDPDRCSRPARQPLPVPALGSRRHRARDLPLRRPRRGLSGR